MTGRPFKDMEPVLGFEPKKVPISNSEIQTFKRCRRRWMLGNYYGLRDKNENFLGPLPLGTRVHAALEHFMNTGEHPADEYNRLQREDNLKFLKTSDALDESKVKKFNEESDLGRIMLEGFYEWLEETNTFSDLEFISQEEKLDYRLSEVDDRIELIAKVDAEVKNKLDGSWNLVDWKTAAGSGFAEYLKSSHHSEQLMHYIMLKNLNTDKEAEKVDGGIYFLLKKVKRTASAKPPFYERVDIRFNKKQIESFWFRTLGTVRDMMNVRDALDRGEDHRYVAYATQKMDWTCNTCPFYQGCFMLDDGSDLDGFYEEYYTQDDPNARYDDERTNNG